MQITEEEVNKAIKPIKEVKGGEERLSKSGQAKIEMVKRMLANGQNDWQRIAQMTYGGLVDNDNPSPNYLAWRKRVKTLAGK